MIALPFTCLAFALLLDVGSSAPTGGSGGPQCSSTLVNANFDDLTLLPGVPGALQPLPVPYKGLLYQAFVPVAPGSLTSGTGLPLPNPIPHSPPNFIRTGFDSQTLQGTPMLTTNYNNSQVGSFDLKSFYFSCVLAVGGQTATAPVTACLIALGGYKGNDDQVSNAVEVCSQQFQYNPSTMTGPQQQAFTGPLLDCFKGVDFVIFQYSLPGGTAAAASDAIMTLDNVVYNLNTC